MATKLDKTVKREIELDGKPFMVAISPDGIKLTQKGFRKGREMSWRALWAGGTEEGGGGRGRGHGGDQESGQPGDDAGSGAGSGAEHGASTMRLESEVPDPELTL